MNMYLRARNIILTLCVLAVLIGVTGLASAPVCADTSLRPSITKQPKNAFAAVGDTAVFSVEADGIGLLNYQWQSRKSSSDAWTNSGQSGARTATLSVKAIAGLNGWQFRCLVSCSSRKTTVTKTVYLTIIPKITTQPKSQSVTAGEKATFTIEATGIGTLKYQWQSRKNSLASWRNSGQSGAKTNTLTVDALAGLNGWQFRCVVTDGNGTRWGSNAATLAVSSIFTKQPSPQRVAVGDRAQFSVGVTGTGAYTYRWQSRKNSTASWSNSGQTGAKTDTLTVNVIAGLNGWQFRCVVTDANGVKSTSNVAALTVIPKITTQPKRQSATVGTTAQFTLEATGKAPLTYQWQSRKNASAAWSNSGQNGAKTNTLSVKMLAGLDGWQFRCIVKDGNGNSVTSSVASLYLGPTITQQPVDQNVQSGKAAAFTVDAIGDGPLTYQWYYSPAVSSSWLVSREKGADTRSFSVSATNQHDGYRYFCIITDSNGKTAFSNVAVLNICAAITQQPSNAVASIGSMADYRITATGVAPLSYQWEYRKDSSSAWARFDTTGADTATLSFLVLSEHKGYQFRCVVTNGYNNKTYSEAAMLLVIDGELTITEKYFPDEIFRQYISEMIDIDKDGILSPEEINAVTSVDVRQMGLQSLQGIEYFVNLEYLTCYGNDLTSVDITANTKLTLIDCDRTTTIIGRREGVSVVHTVAPLKIIAHPENVLTDIDKEATFTVEASGEGTLLYQWQYRKNFTNKWIDAGAKEADKNTLTIKAAAELFGADYRCVITDAMGNQLTSNSAKLTTKTIPINAYAFPDMIFREYLLLHCDPDRNEELSEEERNKVVQILVNNRGISSLQGIEYFPMLEDLLCNQNSLKTLDLRANKELTQLWVGNNQLKVLDLSANTKLEYIYADYNDLKVLDVGHMPKLYHLSCNYNILLSLDVSNNPDLEALSVVDNDLAALDVSKNPKLKELSCAGNRIEKLDVSKNPELISLGLSDNNVSTLDIGNNTKLKNLYCSDNELTKLDISANLDLVNLYCEDNHLTTMDVTKHIKLMKLYCGDNESISELDVQNNTELVELGCGGNGMTDLDIRMNSKLKVLKSSYNSLTKLDLSHNKDLELLYLKNNDLKTLDITGLTKLKDLNCASNELTDLNLTQNSELTVIFVENNDLKSLQVHMNRKLKKITCYGNPIQSLDVSANSELEQVVCSKMTTVIGAGDSVKISYY